MNELHPNNLYPHNLIPGNWAVGSGPAVPYTDWAVGSGPAVPYTDRPALDLNPDTLEQVLREPWMLLPPELRPTLLQCWLSHKHLKGLQQDCVPIAMMLHRRSCYIHDTCDDSHDDDADDHISDVLAEVELSHYKTANALLKTLDWMLGTLAERMMVSDADLMMESPVPAPEA